MHHTLSKTLLLLGLHSRNAARTETTKVGRLTEPILRFPLHREFFAAEGAVSAQASSQVGGHKCISMLFNAPLGSEGPITASPYLGSRSSTVWPP